MVTGSGLLIQYIDDNVHVQFNNIATVSLTDVILSDIVNVAPNPICENKEYDTLMHIPIPNAAASLTILYAQKNYSANIIINRGTFILNTNQFAGAMLIVNFFTNMPSSTRVINSLFNASNNLAKSNECNGALLQYFWYDKPTHKPLGERDVFTIANTNFTNHNSFRAIYVEILSLKLPINFVFRKIVFANNTAANIIGGGCIRINQKRRYVREPLIKVSMTDISAVNNSFFYRNTPTSLFLFSGVQYTVFNGTSSFKNNFGSVIFGDESNVYLKGRMIFFNNTGVNGGAIRMERNCQLYFMKGLNALFAENHAYLSGGAIYMYVCSDLPDICALQTTNDSASNISFLNNSANTAGSSLFATPIYKCTNDRIFNSTWNSHYYRYFNLQRKDETGALLQLSTTPFTFNVSHGGDGTLAIYPGEIFPLKFEVRDYDHRRVFSLVSIEVYTKYEKGINISLSQHGGNRIAEDENSTSIALQIFIYSNIDRNIDAFLAFSSPQTSFHNKILDITIKPCPLGFTLIHHTGSCGCLTLLRNIEGTKCSIRRQTISKPRTSNVWLGRIGKSSTFALGIDCPISYCNNDPRNTHYIITKNGIFLTNHNKKNLPLCWNNRSGTLCGHCYKQSVIFGSSRCETCSNWWLLTILLYTAAGPLFVFALYIFKLTLTAGTLNGIIFYAQVTNAGVLEYVTASCYGSDPALTNTFQSCFFFLSSMNLNLGFPLCFYNGMSELWKTGLSLVFPVYLLTIVVLIIVVSHYSTRISNKISRSAIQVLVTVVHLSSSKLLLALIYVLSSATVRMEHDINYVWYWDGSVTYMGHSHATLLLVTTIVVLILVMPYFVVLIFGSTLIRHSVKVTFYIRPVFEAIHAPYKEGYHYWFVARLILLMVIYIYSALPLGDGNNFYIVIASLLAIFLTGQALFRPFKTRLLNVLDCWLMLNITLVYTMLWNKSSATAAVTAIALLSAVVTLVAIITHHIIMITRWPTKIREVITDAFNVLIKRRVGQQSQTRDESSTGPIVYEIETAGYGTYSKLRESLIEDEIEEL